MVKSCYRSFDEQNKKAYCGDTIDMGNLPVIFGGFESRFNDNPSFWLINRLFLSRSLADATNIGMCTMRASDTVPRIQSGKILNQLS